MKSSYEYFAQEDNELSFGEGQTLEILHHIDEDWWLARDESSGECGMVPANYFGQGETEDQYNQEAEPTEFENEPNGPYDRSVDHDGNETFEEKEGEEVNYYAPPPPPPPMPSFDETEPEEQCNEEKEAEEKEEEEYKNPVDDLLNSRLLKQKCDALFLDSKYAKTKGQLIFEKALFLCTSSTIEHCYDLSELRDYDASELKLTLNSGDKIAIGLGKKDAKKFAELVKEISGYEEPEKNELQKEQAPPLPKAPIVVGPKIPETYIASTSKKSETKTPMIVCVSFEGLEGDEVSIFEGEEVYLLSSEDEEKLADSQFARIEKVNGVQGLVPKNFLMTRSDYQKKKNQDAEIEAEARKQMTELSVTNETNSQKIKPSKSFSNSASSNNVSLSRSDSKKSSPWSALASGSSAVALPKPKQQQQQHKQSSVSVKLENSRLWKDKSGKFQVEAEFVSLIDGKVTILKATGSEVTVPLEILSERDIEYSCKRAGIPYTKKSSTNNTNGTMVKGFDWLAFFLSIGIEAGKAREFGEKFASQSFEESMISAFTSDFLTSQGMQMTEVYKVLPEAAKRKAESMQANAKEKHRNNNSQVVLSAGAPEVKKKPTTSTSTSAAASTLVPFKSEEKSVAIHEDSPKIQMFPTIEELESQGAIELGKGNSQVALPGGISVSKSSNDDSSRVIVQPIESADVKERRREVVGADGSTAKEYTRITTSTSVAPVDHMGSSAIALMQQQMQSNAMMQAQAQAQAQAQVQMQMRMQAQAQMQMQMRAQAVAQAQAQAQAQYQQQQRMYQMQQQQQQSAPSVHITIHTGDKGVNQNPMTPPMPLMNQPMMQMNNAGMMGGMMTPNPMNPMAGAMMTPMNPMAMTTMNPMNPMNNMNNMNPMNPMGSMNPFDPTNPYNNNGFGF